MLANHDNQYALWKKYSVERPSHNTQSYRKMQLHPKIKDDCDQFKQKQEERELTKFYKYDIMYTNTWLTYIYQEKYKTL